VTVGTGVAVGVGTRVGVAVGVKLGVGTGVGARVGVGDAVGVGVGIAVAVGTGLGVWAGTIVDVGAGAIGTLMGLAVAGETWVESEGGVAAVTDVTVLARSPSAIDSSWTSVSADGPTVSANRLRLPTCAITVDPIRFAVVGKTSQLFRSLTKCWMKNRE
jgi:hypothetical protein